MKPLSLLVPTDLFQHFYLEFSPFEEKKLKLFFYSIEYRHLNHYCTKSDGGGEFIWIQLMGFVHSEEGEFKMILLVEPSGPVLCTAVFASVSQYI